MQKGYIATMPPPDIENSVLWFATKGYNIP